MTTLPAPEKPSAILSFDFDGTLHSAAEEPPVPWEFFDIIRKLRVERQVIWGINTGRSVPQIEEGFVESDFPFLPDWIVTREHEIHFPDSQGRWMPHEEWNRLAEQQIHGLFHHARQLMLRLRREVEHHTGARWLELEGDPAGIISQSEDEMEWIVSHIAPMVAEEPELSWQRNSIYLRFGHRDYHKGSSLSKVAELHGLPVSRRFAIGDSHNDLEMLDPAHAGMTACPANAVREIHETVTANGGFVARAVHGTGAVEALIHYFG